MRQNLLLALALQGLLAIGCIVETTGPITTCGASGQACCAGGCNAGLACLSGVCTVASACGAAGAPCCAGGVCGAGLACGAGGLCGVAVTARTPYETCAAGQLCGGGTTCQAAMYSLTGAPGTLCTAGCTSGAQCPASSFFATYLPTCVVSASTGQGLCYDTCVSDADCGGGTRCARIPGTANNICVPPGSGATCGATGQACCAGNACSPGLACTGGVCAAVTANRQPYQKCDVGAGDTCGGGTACVPSIAQVSGKTRGSACTVGCPSGQPTGCPGYVAGSATQTVACANLTGNVAEAQCFRLCATQNDCVDFNTTCTAFTTTTGEARLCVPVGPRL